MQYGDLISVVVPVFNRAHLIARSVGSLCAQTYENIEIILVDDCSSDDLEAAVLALGDPRVRLLRRSRNGGAAAARNDGVQAAKAEVIAFHDSDDICVFDRIEKQARLLSSLGPDHVGVHCARLLYLETTEETWSQSHCLTLPEPHRTRLSGALFTDTVRGNFISVPTMLLRKSSILAAGGFDERLRNNEDWDFALRLTRVGAFGFVPEPLYLTVQHLPKARKSQHISYNDRYSALSFVRVTGKLRTAGVSLNALSNHHATAARFLLRIGKPHSARRFAWLALRGNPASAPAVKAVLFAAFPMLYRMLRRRG
ncbi:MAG: glycosyltransferase family 2 protein [Rhodobacteraceae bacterium]|nr:glycosyltransferase family 2 protein [Paracoccaceae bacterium]